MFEVQRSTREDDVRVTTAFKRMLRLPGASVKDVAFGGEGVVVTVRLPPSGRSARAAARADWRSRSIGRSAGGHLDLGAGRCYIECLLRRLYCPGCGDVYEAVPWARAGSRYTRDLEADGDVRERDDPAGEQAARALIDEVLKEGACGDEPAEPDDHEPGGTKRVRDVQPRSPRHGSSAGPRIRLRRRSP